MEYLGIEPDKQNSILKNYFNNKDKIPSIVGIERRELGAYYTDEHIVNYILRKLRVNPDSSILDPSCGCGSFIFPLYLKVSNKNDHMGKVYGVDIDPKAVSYTVNTLNSLSGRNGIDKIKSHIITEDFIFKPSISDTTANKANSNAPEILIDGSFDFIVGNPPFNLINQKNKIPLLTKDAHRYIGNRARNVPIYFILRGMEILKEGGILAYVLPKTILYVNRYKEFRDYILQNFTIIRITEIGRKFKGVRGEQIILFLKNKKPRANSSIEFSEFIGRKNIIKKDNNYKINQNYFNSLNVIPTLPDLKSYKIIKKLQDLSPSQIFNLDKVGVFRGISIGSDIIKTIPYIKGSKVQDDYFIRGKDISKLHLKHIAVFNMKACKEQELTRLRTPKIILQNIYSSESGLISYLDMEGIPTTETVTNIILEDKKKLAYMFALLNSKLINFYLSQVIFSRSRLTMHVDGTYLRQLPLIWNPEREETEKIAELGANSHAEQHNGIKPILKAIDKQVYSLYDMDDESKKLVEEIMAKTLSNKSLW